MIISLQCRIAERHVIQLLLLLLLRVACTQTYQSQQLTKRLWIIQKQTVQQQQQWVLALYEPGTLAVRAPPTLQPGSVAVC